MHPKPPPNAGEGSKRNSVTLSSLRLPATTSATPPKVTDGFVLEVSPTDPPRLTIEAVRAAFEALHRNLDAPDAVEALRKLGAELDRIGSMSKLQSEGLKAMSKKMPSLVHRNRQARRAATSKKHSPPTEWNR